MQCTYCCFAGVNQNGLLDFLLTITIAWAHLLPSHQEAACLHCVIHLSTSCLHPKLVAKCGNSAYAILVGSGRYGASLMSIGKTLSWGVSGHAEPQSGGSC